MTGTAKPRERLHSLGRLVGIERPGATPILQVTDYTLPELPASPSFPCAIARYCTPTQT